MRVPTPTFFRVELVAFVEKKTSEKKVNCALKESFRKWPSEGLSRIEENELVSADFRLDGPIFHR